MSVEAVEKNIVTGIISGLKQQPWVISDQNRLKALAEFEALGLPAPKAEEYKFTPVTRHLEKNFDLSVVSPKSQASAKPFIINDLEADRIVFINGDFSAEQSSIVSTNDITVTPLEEAMVESSGRVLPYLTNDADGDGLVAWNNAGWNHGVFIQVNAGKKVQRPIVIHYVSDATEGQVISVSRNVIRVEEGSEATVIEKFDSVGGNNHFVNIVTDASVANNASLNLYSIQRDGANHYQFNRKRIHQGNGSRVNTFTFTLDGALVRNNLHLILDGENIESHMYGLYLLGGKTLADNHTVVDHKKPNSFSNEMYKGIMDDQSKGVFNGKIYVRPQAQKTNAFQANRNILLSEQASVNTKPQLEIWADDVKCSHGCTSGQLDEEAMFYLQSRGIKKETARAMMLYAFAGEVLETVAQPVLKNYLDTIISERLHKNF